MQVFKMYFRLLRSYKGVLILYTAVFLGVALVMVGGMSNGDDEKKGDFEAERLDIGIINRDSGSFAGELSNYFFEEHNIVDLEDDEDAVLNKLYWREVDYVLVVPAGFEEAFVSGENTDMELNCMKVPGSFASSFFEAELSLYLSKLTGLVKSGNPLSDAFTKMEKIREKKAEVAMASYVNENQNDKMSSFFLYVPYLFISLGVNGVGLVLIAFNQKEVKDRMECAAMPLRVRLMWLTCGILLFGVILYILVLAVAAVITKGTMFQDSRMPYFMLNMLTLLLFSLSLGFFAGTVAKNNDTLSGINNVLGLGLCFLGGVFVPQEFFGEAVLKVAKFFPTYWYVKANTAISSMATGAEVQELRGQVLLVVFYALAIFALTTVVISAKRKRAA